MARTSRDSIIKAIGLADEEIKKIFELREKIGQFRNSIDWNDDKGSNLNSLLSEIEKCLLVPMPKLRRTREKLMALCEIVEKYDGIKF